MQIIMWCLAPAFAPGMLSSIWGIGGIVTTVLGFILMAIGGSMYDDGTIADTSHLGVTVGWYR